MNEQTKFEAFVETVLAEDDEEERKN